MKKLGYLIIVISIPFFYLMFRLHMQNYFKGKRELSRLRQFEAENKITSPTRPDKFIYVAHGGGGYKGVTYLSNLEALNNSYSLGVDFIEVDVNYSMDSVPVLAHDFVNKFSEEFLEDRSKGTPMLLSDLLHWMSDKQIYIVTDIKVDNLKILEGIKQDFPNESGKLIPQVYTITEIIQAKKMGYDKIIFTNYMSVYPNQIISDLAMTKSLFGITVPYDRNFKIFCMLNDFKQLATPIFTHTLNDAEVVSELYRKGVGGVYTDFLLESSRIEKSISSSFLCQFLVIEKECGEDKRSKSAMQTN